MPMTPLRFAGTVIQTAADIPVVGGVTGLDPEIDPATSQRLLYKVLEEKTLGKPGRQNRDTEVSTG